MRARCPTVLSLVFVAGCSGDVVDGFAEQHDDSTRHTEVVCNLPTALNLVELELVAVADDSVEFMVHNNHDEVAEIQIRNNTFGDGEERSTTLGELVLEPLSSRTVVVPSSDLSLLRRIVVDHGKTFISATASFTDGRLDSSLLDPVYYSLKNESPQLSASREAFATGVELAYSQEWAAAVEEQPIAIEKAVVNKRLCFQQIVVFADGAVGEDTFATTSPVAFASVGQDVVVQKTGQQGVISTATGDFTNQPYGCTPALNFQTGTNTVYALAHGTVKGHFINVDTPIQHQFNINISSSTADQWFTFDPTSSAAKDEFNVYQAAAYTVALHASTGSQSLTLHANTAACGNPPVAPCGTYFDGGSDIYIEGGGDEGPVAAGNAREKFTIAHEVGHWILDIAADEPGVNYTVTGSGSCASGTTSHGLRSIEFQTTAFMEGFASFIAGAVYNNYGLGVTQDCFVSLASGTVVNCDAANINFPIAVMETNCAAPFQGMGVETDWHRTFWDMLKNGNPSVAAMTSWINTANDTTAWATNNAYSLLNSRANAIGGVLNTDWDSAAPSHGIDWPL